VVPVGLAVMASAVIANWMANLGSGTRALYFGPSWYYQAIGWVVAAIGPVAIANKAFSLMRYTFAIGLWDVLVAVVTGIALIQTHRAFAGRRQETTRTFVRALTPIALATLLCALAVEGLQLAAMQAYWQQEQVLEQTHEAIVANIAATDQKVERLTWDELSRDSNLSSGARKWLRNASITVVRDSPQLSELAEEHFGMPAPSTLWSRVPNEHAGPVRGYLAVVHLASGSECSLKFDRTTGSRRKWFGGWIRGTCN
jgi:hypothetical protein